MAGTPIDVPLVVVGCDFRNAAVRFRELLVTTPEERAGLLRGIASVEPAAGFAAMETCNRIEWMVSTESPEWVADLLRARMLQRWQHGLPDAEVFPEPYVFSGRRAARHLLRVVAGLESLAAGEAQIAGQFQDALQRSRDEGMSSYILNGLTNPAGRLAKSGYRIGFRADHHTGIHGMTADYLLSLLDGNAADKTVAVVGMGSIGRKTAEMLTQISDVKVLRVNRTVKPEHASSWRPLEELTQLAPQVDAMIIATGGLTPVIQPEHLAAGNRAEPLLVLDIGIPRQVSSKAQQLEGVDYRNLDDLVKLRARHENSRSVDEVQQEVDKEVARFKRYCIERSIVSLLEDSQRRRQEFIQRQIPFIIESELGELDGKMRKQVEAVMKKLISDFSADSFDSIHESLEKHWSSK